MGKILKNLFLQNHWAQKHEISYVAAPSDPLPNLLKMIAQNGPAKGGSGVEPQKYTGNIQKSVNSVEVGLRCLKVFT